ncbi:MAG: hypothetical protein WKF90_00205 [Pyrinomonadaceae bacterium]
MSKIVHQIFIKVYGVKICIETNKKAFLKELKNEITRILPVKVEFINSQISDHTFYIEVSEGEKYELYKNEKSLGQMLKSDVLVVFDSRLRLTVGEFAVSKVFLHAGVVSWKGEAIVIPANSFKGKTSLVAELVKKGALYYSDEYAVLNRDGCVEPFPKQLSLRGIVNEYAQVDRTVESLGGRKGTKKIPVGMILLTEFKPQLSTKKWKPRLLSPGRGVMEILPHTISIRNDTKLALNVLNKIASRAIIAKSKRGEAKEFVDLLINFFENHVNKN